MLRQLNLVELSLPQLLRLGVLPHHTLQLDGLQMHLVPLHPDPVHLLAVATFVSAVKPDGRSLGKLRRAGQRWPERWSPSFSLSPGISAFC